MKEETPRANRFYIGLFGRRNSGKSSLVNALTGQDTAIVSDVPGTTTDAVQKNMELPGIGAAVIVDTAGYDDEGGLGTLRVERTRKMARKMDLALLVVSGMPDEAESERRWLACFESEEIPVIAVCNKMDTAPDGELQAWERKLGRTLCAVSAMDGRGLDVLRDAMAAVYKRYDDLDDLTGTLVGEGDTVLLVMPQDLQAPKGRLILPQVQTLRNLLDKHCLVHCCTAESLPAMLAALQSPPALIITDSQVFPAVEAQCPPATRLTSFSVLFARQKGDIRSFVDGADALRRLRPDARVLIAEACTHVPLHEDIGRVKLPRLLRKRFGDRLSIDIVSGNDFPENLSGYDLVIHCGACMFTRRHVMSRLRQARVQHVPMTNYGVAIACLTGILDKVVYPD